MPVRTTALAFFLVLLTALPLAAQSATDGTGEWTRKSTIPLTEPTEIPGMVLEPGTYVFKIWETRGDRFSVQVLNQSETQILTTITAVTDSRVRPDDDSLLTYHVNSGKAGNPRAVHSWFYPGELNGYEFVYPIERAKELARLSNDYVMAMGKNSDAIVAITANGTEVPIYGASKTTANGTDTQRQKPSVKPKSAGPLALKNGHHWSN
jgi:hypothetical protein